MASPEFIRLRYRAKCSDCGAELAPRTEARWDRQARKATCRTCVEGTEDSAEPAVVSERADPTGEVEMIERGVPGASAARRFERLHERREQRARERYGRLSGIYLALTDDPQPTKAWDVGSWGERALGRYLETLHNGESIVVLHDRRIPGTRANIDHLAVTASGIHAIDAKNYTGKVQRVDKGAWSGHSKNSDPIFASRNGTPLTHRNVTRRGFEAAATKAGIDGVSFHKLRHAAASRLIDAGLSPVVVAKILGHTDATVTLRIYAHQFDRQRTDEAVRQALADASST
jgi:hypothetical protein